ncbi:MAG: hypothetical protein J0I06_26430 [Planctomycetes bacterium]|nr:hypothetical protein [Planctomycetota bacterium]
MSSSHKPLRARLGLEVLGDRITPAAGFDVAVFTARLEAPTLIRFSFYENDPAVIPVGVYRSADPTLDASDQLVGSGAITPPAGGGFGVASAALNGPLVLDPSRDYVLVVADPNNQVAEFNESNNIAVFRKFAVAAVVHGLSLDGNPGAFLAPFAAQVQAEGYDFVLPYVWTPLSQTASPNATVIAGRNLAQFFREVATLAGPNDVVDVHLIGHSRGASVVSQAFQDLTVNPGPHALAMGYFKETLLDPHAATNFGPAELGAAEVALAPGSVGTSLVGQFSFDKSNPLGQTAALAVLAFQAAANDPLAFVPASVDEAEVYYQQLPADQATWTPPGASQTVEQSIGVNLFGQVPVANPFSRPVRYVDLGPQKVGHSEVPDWYLLNVVPTLGG